MGFQVYEVGRRWGGYGVPAFCEHPDCDKEINRGMVYACGGEPFSEVGCDRYFCSKHLFFVGFKCDGSDERCNHIRRCKCEFKQVCERCAEGEAPFPYKPEHPEWVEWLLTDESWHTWRKKNPAKVAELKAQQTKTL